MSKFFGLVLYFKHQQPKNIQFGLGPKSEWLFLLFLNIKFTTQFFSKTFNFKAINNFPRLIIFPKRDNDSKSIIKKS